ncbi:uncharacterized protein LOC113305441 [Papaver somniferum]|uniref:uncharacterized protein LOC113305441 n=1 Tax=Papaver somniferum TaxID=3469 RepID=UPI000E7027AB|nr:uncharacterized protein LOC113305441 [Papaver somniferum]
MKAEETLNHLIIDCDYSRSVWLGMHVNVSVLQTQHIQVKDWILSWFQQHSTVTTQEFSNWIAMAMITAWFLWKNRCLKEFDNKNQSICSTIFYIKNMLKYCTDQYNQSSTHIDAHWSPPASEELKINMDASFDRDSSYVGIGLILRNSTGTCESIRGRLFHGGIDPEHAECLDFKEAIHWATKKGMQKVTFEGDCLNVINSVKHAKSSVHWMNEGLVNEIKHLLSKISWCNVNCVRRQENSVAHVIVNEARTGRRSFEYHCNIPDIFMK